MSRLRRIAALIAVGTTLAAVSAAGAQATIDHAFPRVPVDCACVDLANV